MQIRVVTHGADRTEAATDVSYVGGGAGYAADKIGTENDHDGWAQSSARLSRAYCPAGRSPAEWRANLERHFDVDVFLRWLAVNQVVDNWDVYGRFAHNYYLYADPGRTAASSGYPGTTTTPSA